MIFEDYEPTEKKKLSKRNTQQLIELACLTKINRQLVNIKTQT
jgi:hypothetical protein